MNHDVLGSQYQRKLKELSDFKTKVVLNFANLKENQVNEVCIEVIPECINTITVLAKENTRNARKHVHTV